MWWALQFLALLAYFAGLAFGVVLLNVAVLAVAIWLRSPRARRRSVTSPSDRAPVAALSPTPGERRWRA